MRKPFQGVFNILRFNWHFYFLSFIFLALLFFSADYFSRQIQLGIYLGICVVLAQIVTSLVVSFWVYDRSNLYEFPWLNGFSPASHFKILTVNAGFDEVSDLLRNKFTNSEIICCDFYDPIKHTEISLQRARKAYPPNPQSVPVSTKKLPFPSDTFDLSLAILSAHEIRSQPERINFLRELSRVTKQDGAIFITEHLRDFPNFLAFTIGFFHFHSRATWLKTFHEAGLSVKQEVKTTPFITTFILEKNGTAL